jgi:hypothetical protein
VQDDPQEKHTNGCDDEGHFCKIGDKHGEKDCPNVIRNCSSEKAILVDTSPWDTKKVTLSFIVLENSITNDGSMRGVSHDSSCRRSVH